MKKLALFAVAAVTMLVMAGSVNAASEYKQAADTAKKGMAEESMAPDDYRGMDVFSQAGEQIGIIKAAKVNDENGRIEYFTISKGGVLGVGGKEVAIPTEALMFEKNKATLAVETSKLDNAPMQANLSDKEFLHNLTSHYGVSPAWEDPSGKMEMDEAEPPTKTE